MDITDTFEFTMLIKTRMTLNCAMCSPRDRTDRVGGADAAGHPRNSRPTCVYRALLVRGCETYQSRAEYRSGKPCACVRGSVVQARSVSIQFFFFGWVAWGFKSGVCVVSDFSIRGDGYPALRIFYTRLGKPFFLFNSISTIVSWALMGGGRGEALGK